MTQRILAVGRTQAPFSIIEVLPGLRIALLPGESLAAVVAALVAHFDEVERRPGLAEHEPPEWFSQPDEVYRCWDAEDRPLDFARW